MLRWLGTTGAAKWMFGSTADVTKDHATEETPKKERITDLSLIIDEEGIKKGLAIVIDSGLFQSTRKIVEDMSKGVTPHELEISRKIRDNYVSMVTELMQKPKCTADLLRETRKRIVDTLIPAATEKRKEYEELIPEDQVAVYSELSSLLGNIVSSIDRKLAQ